MPTRHDRDAGGDPAVLAAKAALREHVWAVADLDPVEVVVTGCVAAGRDGARLGKGGGFSDLELALAAAAGLVDERTLVVTTVHPVQLVDAGAIPTTPHDIHVDLIATPDGVIACPRRRGHRLPALDWDQLTDDKIAAIPLLTRLAASRNG